MNTIKDTIHDHIDLPDYATALLDTAPMQRLRRITQLGTVPLVYPSATHTRFAHSIGAAHLAHTAANHLALDTNTTKHLVAAALLHDTAHPPYSHATDHTLAAHGRGEHDDFTIIYDRLTDITDTLTTHNLTPDRIARLITGDPDEPYSDLIAGTIDVDRLDYLARDAAATGVPYGDIDHERLLRTLDTRDNHVVLDGGAHAAENVLIARAHMTTTVYAHHAARAANAVLRRATTRLLDTDAATPEEIRRMDEHEYRATLRREQPDAARRLDNRDLPKRAAWLPPTAAPPRLQDAAHNPAQRRDLETEIADTAGVPAQHVWIHTPPRDPGEGFAEAAIPVTTGDNQVARLDQISALVATLNDAGAQWWRAAVFAASDDVRAVRDAARRVLGVPDDTAMVQDRDTAHYDTDAHRREEHRADSATPGNV